MRPTHIHQALKYCVSQGRVTMLWGPPGVGKSDIVRQVAGELGCEMLDVRAVLLDPVDLRGLPSVANGVTHWNIPAFLPTEGKGILFLDEITAAPPMTQAALYQLTLDRAIGEYTLPEEWQIICAGNREQDGAVSHKMPTALRNRLTHLELEVDINDWTAWANINGIEPVVLAFLRTRPELLHVFSKDQKAFPTPRSWKFVSDLMEGGGVGNQEVEHGLITGTVGEGAAVEFSAYLRLYRNLPDIDTILANPKGVAVPRNAGELYAIAAMIAKFLEVKNIGAAMQYLARIPAEYCIMAIQDAVKRDRGLTKTKQYIDWAVRNQEVIL